MFLKRYLFSFVFWVSWTTATENPKIPKMKKYHVTPKTETPWVWACLKTQPEACVVVSTTTGRVDQRAPNGGALDENIRFPTDVHDLDFLGEVFPHPDCKVEMEDVQPEHVVSTPAVKSDDLCNIFAMWNYPHGTPLCLDARIFHPRFGWGSRLGVNLGTGGI